MGHDETTNDETLRRHANWPMEGESSPTIDELLERAKLAPREKTSDERLDETLKEGHEELLEKVTEKLWPYTSVYFMPNGDVEVRTGARREMHGSSVLAQQAFMVLLVKHPKRPFEEPEIECTKFRGDLGKFMECIARGYLLQPGAEQEIMQKILGHDPEVDG